MWGVFIASCLYWLILIPGAIRQQDAPLYQSAAGLKPADF